MWNGQKNQIYLQQNNIQQRNGNKLFMTNNTQLKAQHYAQTNDFMMELDKIESDDQEEQKVNHI